MLVAAFTALAGTGGHYTVLVLYSRLVASGPRHRNVRDMRLTSSVLSVPQRWRPQLLCAQVPGCVTEALASRVVCLAPRGRRGFKKPVTDILE